MRPWDRIVDIADIVTAGCAVAGLVLATWLSLKAIRVAKGDSDRAFQEFVYGKVDAVLDAALALTSATSHLAESASSRESEAEVTKSLEAFESRLHILSTLDDRSAGVRTGSAKQFSWGLAQVARASARLRGEGRAILAPSVFDGESDGPGLLPALSRLMHGHDGFEDPHGSKAVEPSDGRVLVDGLDAFAPSAAYAASLRDRLGGPQWQPTVFESIRLVLPWLYLTWGWLYVQFEQDDGTPGMVMENDWGAYFDESTQTMTQPPHPMPVLATWLQEWPQVHHQEAGHLELMDSFGMEPPTVSPEELLVQMFEDLKGAYLDSVVSLVTELRGATTPQATTRLTGRP